jgi:hypothetical protein
MLLVRCWTWPIRVGTRICLFRFEADHLMYVDENRQQLVNAGAIPVLVSLLNSPDTDVQYYCTTALSNIAVDGTNRKKLAQSEPKLVTSLVMLMDSSSLKVQCQAALALRNLASDGNITSFVSQVAAGLTLSYREISTRNCQSWWPLISSPLASIDLSAPHSFLSCLCSQCLHTSAERVSHHRVRLPPTSH